MIKKKRILSTIFQSKYQKLDDESLLSQYNKNAENDIELNNFNELFQAKSKFTHINSHFFMDLYSVPIDESDAHEQAGQFQLGGNPRNAQQQRKLLPTKHAMENLRNMGGVAAVLDLLKVDPKIGLSCLQEDDLQLRQHIFGVNEIQMNRKQSIFQVFRQIVSRQRYYYVILLTLVMVVLKFFYHAFMLPQESMHIRTEVGTFLIISIIVVMKTYSAYRNSLQMMNIQNSINKDLFSQTRVLRDAKEIIISSEDVVVGDIILLQSGDLIGVDGILVENQSLLVQESIQQQTNDIKKQVMNGTFMDDYIDQYIYSGSKIMVGSGKLVVISVGRNKITSRLLYPVNLKDNQNPLQEKLSVICAVIGRIGINFTYLLAAILCARQIYQCTLREDHLTFNDLIKFIQIAQFTVALE